MRVWRWHFWGNVCSVPLLRLQRRVNTQTAAAWQMEPAAAATPRLFIWAETGIPSTPARRDRDPNFRHHYLWPPFEHAATQKNSIKTHEYK
jgi:hypothetical protein